MAPESLRRLDRLAMFCDEVVAVMREERSVVTPTVPLSSPLELQPAVRTRESGPGGFTSERRKRDRIAAVDGRDRLVGAEQGCQEGT